MENTIFIRFKLVGAYCDKIKITQSNTAKSCIVGRDNTATPVEQSKSILSKLDNITFKGLIDNTQDKYFDYVIDFTGYEIPDFISKIKNK